jgi:hypothetical protein
VSQSIEQKQEESESKIAQRRSQRACWALLKRIHPTLDLRQADVIEVQAVDAAAHIALLARQFPGLHFELAQEATRCDQSIRVLWAPNGIDPMQSQHHYETYDAVIVTHDPALWKETLKVFAGFARIAALRDIGDGLALGVFGKGLSRALFRPRARDPLAA